MKQIHDLFYKDGEVSKPLAYGDIITITEPDAVKAPYPEAFGLIMQEPVTFNVKLSKNDCKWLKRVFGMFKPQLVGRRIAKRNNRLRRLARYKAGKTYHGTIKKIVRQYNRIIKTPLVYCSTETCLQEVSVTEAAKRLMWAEPSPSVPVIFVMDESDAEEWKRAGTRQRPDEWNPDERGTRP